MIIILIIVSIIIILIIMMMIFKIYDLSNNDMNRNQEDHNTFSIIHNEYFTIHLKAAKFHIYICIYIYTN